MRGRRQTVQSLFLFVFAAFFIQNLSAASSATLIPSATVPQAGTVVTFNATVPPDEAGSVWYRFRVRKLGSDYNVIRDFGPSAALDWPAYQDGSYEMEVAARDNDSGEIALAYAIIKVNPAATNVPVVTPTANSLVFLYSEPPCPSGQRMRVEFQGPDQVPHVTPYKECKPGSGMNFLLGGMLPETLYSARHRIDTGTQFLFGSSVSFITGSVPTGLARETVPTILKSSTLEPVLLTSQLYGPAVAFDLVGNIIWYGPATPYTVTRPESGGYMWSVVEVQQGSIEQQRIRKFDLSGQAVLETNAARVNEQLTAMGKRTISAFHHEARTLPDGRILALASVEQILTDVQGPGPVDVIGDMIIVFDQNLQVVWTWDTFDNLDPHKSAILGETCGNAASCPPHYLSKTANDWTHGNSVQQTPDGQLLYSTRHLDWLIKISYNNGEGDGHIIWKMGKDGDFQFLSMDPYPWFSHQHDANFEDGDPTMLDVFDNGNTRVTLLNQGYSRGMVLQVDEANRAVTPVLVLDAGLYSIALGTAQRLQNGDMNFDFGYVVEASAVRSYALESDSSGNVAYGAKADVPIYRSVRMSDIYTPY